MPMKFVNGDMFTYPGLTVLVNPVNCVGVMGKGLAFTFKQHYPYMFERYKQDCHDGLMTPGFVNSYYVPKDKIHVWCFPTKRHWRDRSLLSDIENGLINMNARLKDLDHEASRFGWSHNVAVPPLGCGLGGLDWNTQVYPLFQQYLNDDLKHVQVTVFASQGGNT